MNIIFEVPTSLTREDILAVIKVEGRPVQIEGIINPNVGAYFTDEGLASYLLLDASENLATWQFSGARDDFLKEGFRPSIISDSEASAVKVISAKGMAGYFVGSQSLYKYDAAQKELMDNAKKIDADIEEVKKVLLPFVGIVALSWVLSRVFCKK